MLADRTVQFDGVRAVVVFVAILVLLGSTAAHIKSIIGVNAKANAIINIIMDPMILSSVFMTWGCLFYL